MLRRLMKRKALLLAAGCLGSSRPGSNREPDAETLPPSLPAVKFSASRASRTVALTMPVSSMSPLRPPAL